MQVNPCPGFRYGGFSCTVLLLFAGFLIPPNSMSPVFGWLHYLNPMFYGFENVRPLDYTYERLTKRMLTRDDHSYLPMSLLGFSFHARIISSQQMESLGIKLVPSKAH